MSLFYSSVVDMHADQMLLSSYSLDLCDVWYRWTLTTFSQSRHRVNGSNDETGTTRACSFSFSLVYVAADKYPEA